MGTTALTEAVFYILLSLDTPLHGYGIMQNVEHLSGGRVRLAAGTLYGANLRVWRRRVGCWKSVPTALTPTAAAHRTSTNTACSTSTNHATASVPTM